MKWSDAALLLAGGLGIFFAGVVWRPVFGDQSNIKGALECTSFIATTVAAIVATYTLHIWKLQFRHSERFSTLKTLKNAATDLHSYRGYLLTVVAQCDAAIRGSIEDESDLRQSSHKKMNELKDALSAYNKAWASAVPFFTQKEEREFPGAPNKFIELFLARPNELMNACEACLSSNLQDDYLAVVASVDQEARTLYASTIQAIELMLRQKI